MKVGLVQLSLYGVPAITAAIVQAHNHSDKQSPQFVTVSGAAAVRQNI